VTKEKTFELGEQPKILKIDFGFLKKQLII
jgi:hypothetical protein